MGDADHVVSDLGLLVHTLGTQADYDERRAHLTLVNAPGLLHRSVGGRDLGVGVAHASSRRAAASLSRTDINNGTRGETAPLASAMLRCARAIPRSSSASTRSSST